VDGCGKASIGRSATASPEGLAHGSVVIQGASHSIGEEFVRTPEITRGAASVYSQLKSYDIL
jgi:hypothetical protein